MFDRIKYRLKQLILVLSVSMLIIAPSYAVTAADVPQPSENGSYIIDLADILDANIEAEINSAIAFLEQHKNKSIYIVTVPSMIKAKVSTVQKFVTLTNTSPSRKFLNSIFSNWNIKQLHQGNSIFILVSMKERRVELKTGFNLRYITKDRHIQGVIDKIIIPEFKQHNFNRGTLLGTKVLIDKIDNPYIDSTPKPDNFGSVGQEYKNKALCQTYQSTFWCSSEGRDRGGSGNW